MSDTKMTDEQFRAELSPEYLEWSEDPSNDDISGPVEEIQRLCEVIVGLRARIAELEGALKDEEERHQGTLGLLEGADAQVLKQAAELEQLKSKVSSLAQELTNKQVECRQLQEDLETVRTDKEGVWLWQSDGHDDPDSLVCPVVMSAETLRWFTGKADKLQLIENVIANPIDPHTDLRHIAEVVLDRAPAQGEPQDGTVRATAAGAKAMSLLVDPREGGTR